MKYLPSTYAPSENLFRLIHSTFVHANVQEVYFMTPQH